MQHSYSKLCFHKIPVQLYKIFYKMFCAIECIDCFQLWLFLCYVNPETCQTQYEVFVMM